MYNTRVFPQEIAENIIAELWRDSDSITLRSCALVCKSFCSPSQRQLFKIIFIHRREDFLNISRVLCMAPHLAPLVRYLIIFTLLPRMGSVQWPDNIIRPDVFCTLSRLRSISIHSQAFWDDLPADLKAVFQTIFSLPTLSKVSIGPNVYLPASLVFKPPLTSFEWGLLGPGNQFCYEDAGHLPAAPLPKRVLKTLSLSMTSQIPQWAFDWLMDRHCPIAINRLEALRIFVYDSYEPTLSLEILQGTAKSLTILHLEINSMWTREPIDLSQCSNLRKLYLRFYHWLEATDDDDEDPPSSSLNGTIGTLPPDNNVEEIGIRLDRLRDDLHLDEEETLTDIVSELPWEELDQLLNQPRMEKLRSVLWKVNKEFGAIIVQCLPETHQRGLLTFTHKSDAEDEDDPMLVVGHRFGF